MCDLYGEWRRGITATTWQTHAEAEKLFVDFAGDTVAVFDALTLGQSRAIQTSNARSLPRSPRRGGACLKVEQDSWSIAPPPA